MYSACMAGFVLGVAATLLALQLIGAPIAVTSTAISIPFNAHENRNISGMTSFHNPFKQRTITGSTKVSPAPKCRHNFTVYVYPSPAHLSSIRVSEEARANGSLHVCHKCILEQFSLEYVIFDFFTQFCGRVYDPNLADYFYLPIVRDAELRLLMTTSTARDRPPFPAEQALLQLLEKGNSSLFETYFQVSDEHWRKRGGADHIIVMPAPVTNLRHERSARGFFHYMVHLHAPVFIALEYSKSFVLEYPICSTRKNIVVPYPTIDPDLYSHKWKPPSPRSNRSALLFYSGGLHGDCMEVRIALHALIKNSSRIAGVLPSTHMNMRTREEGFLHSVFCPVPVGDSPSSKRMYDVLNFGCIPVLLSDDIVWAYSHLSGGTLNASLFALQLPQSVVHFSAETLLAKFSHIHFPYLPVSGINAYDLLRDSLSSGGAYERGQYVNPLVQILRRVPYEDQVFLREQGEVHAEYFRYFRMSAMDGIPIASHVLPDGGAIDMLSTQLEKRRNEGLTSIRDACVAERGRTHAYIGRFPCDSTNKPQKKRNRKKGDKSKL